MNKDLRYYVWYHKVFGKNIGPARVLKEYGSIKDFYEAVISGKEEAASKPKKLQEAKQYSLIDADGVVAVCEKNGWDIITADSGFFPEMLKEIPDCPILLFVHGKKEVLTRSVGVGIVGSRKLSEKAEKITQNAAYNLAKTGAVIVSGAALGADSAAHKGACEAEGETIAVLGYGFGGDNKKRIGEMYDHILSHGAFVTELFPYDVPAKYTFPERNRIISGISRAVLVTYAEEKSGSLITAELAKKQGRRVYALAPEIYSSDGCDALIADNAYVFYNAGDIAYPLKERYDEGLFKDGYCNRPVTIGVNEASEQSFGQSSSEKKTSGKKTEKTKAAEKKPQEEKKTETALPEDLSEDAVKIYRYLSSEAVSIDSLVGALGIPASRLMASASELVVRGFARFAGGSRIQKIK